MEEDIKSKVCTKCEVEKDLEEFHNDRKGKYGKYYWCKECCKKQKKRYYKQSVEMR